MMIVLHCGCGAAFESKIGPAAGNTACPKCGRVLQVPAAPPIKSEQGQKISRVDDEEADRTWIPLLVGLLGALVVFFLLLWAILMPSSPGGGGAGDGNGRGHADSGEGPGTGSEGEGGGAGAHGSGQGVLGADGSEGLESPSDSVAPSPPAPATSAPAAASAPEQQTATSRPEQRRPTQRPPTTLPVGMSEPPIHRRDSRPRQAAPIGESGVAGGSSGGVKVGEDPGARGDISFTLIWDFSTDRQSIGNVGGPDIDMWVIDPHGHRLSTSRDDFGLGPTPCEGRIDYDDVGAWRQLGAPVRRAQGFNGGPERAFWPPHKAPAGTYHYGIRWYQGEGSAKYTVRVYLGNKIQATQTGTLTQQDAPRIGIELGTVDSAGPG